MKQLLIDAAHSDMGFKIRHMMVSNVKGTLTDYSGGMKYENEDMSDAEIRFEGDVRSITTGNSDRDTHLNGEDFFHTERFPKILFCCRCAVVLCAVYNAEVSQLAPCKILRSLSSWSI